MIVEDERDGYTHFDVLKFQQGEDTRTSHVDLTYSTDKPSNIANMMVFEPEFLIDKCINSSKPIWLKIYGLNLDMMETTTKLGCFSNLFLCFLKKIYV